MADRGVGDEEVLRAVGEDAFDALQFAMQMIGATLYSHVELNGVKLRWLDESSPDLGFPNPAHPASRDRD